MRYMVVFHDGSKREITGEDGKYWLTGDTRIRKLSEQILCVEEAEEEAPSGSTGKKPAKRKKKAASEE